MMSGNGRKIYYNYNRVISNPEFQDCKIQCLHVNYKPINNKSPILTNIVACT